MGKKSTKSSNTPWKEAQPYILGGAQAVQDTYTQNAGKVQGVADQFTGLVPGLLEQYAKGDPTVNAAQGYNTDVLSGKYLDQGNPYLQDMINRSIGDSTNATQASLGLRGLTGGSSYADIISRNAANTSLGMRYADYGAERDRMANASGQAGALAAADQIPLQSAFNAGGMAMLPGSAAGQYAGSIGGLLGAYGTQKTPGGWGNDLLSAGTAIGSAAIMASERRVKKDIERIGTLDDGLGVYNFRYLWDEDGSPVHTGVMVDEVERLRPWALGPVIGGIQTVDMTKLEAR